MYDLRKRECVERDRERNIYLIFPRGIKVILSFNKNIFEF